MNLQDYIKLKFDNVRVIGVTNPSVIVSYNDYSFLFYRNIGGGEHKYVMCYNDVRVYFDQPDQAYEVLMKEYAKIKQSEYYENIQR